MRKTFKKNKKIKEVIGIDTPLGKLYFARNVDYCPYCGKTFGQNDEMLGICGNHRMTKDLLEIVTYSAQMIAGFKNAKKVLMKLSGIEISESQIKILSEEVGKEVYENQMKTAGTSYSAPENAAPASLDKDKKEAVLYITMDGSAVNTRVQDEAGSSWREMKLGLTFVDKDIIRRKNNDGIIINKEYVTHMGSVNEFKKLLFDSAARAGYGSVEKTVVIGDGAHWIWNMCDELFPDAEYILDYYHMSENIYNYAKELFPGDEKKYKKWAETIIYYIETQQIKRALTRIDSDSGKLREGSNPPNLTGYIKNNIDKINYLDYKNKNYYIGSGMIESGNKLVIQKRMKQAGMRWSVNGAQYMATLRAKYESNRWCDVEKTIFNTKVS